MKPKKNQATSIAGLSNLSTEAKLCFGAASGCLILGMIGYAINALTTMETTLSAFLVISAFYFLLGMINLRKGQPAYAVRNSENSGRKSSADFVEDHGDDEFVESAA
jgi:hypothetical protein